jgi:hypothetical protein
MNPNGASSVSQDINAKPDTGILARLMTASPHESR